MPGKWSQEFAMKPSQMEELWALWLGLAKQTQNVTVNLLRNLYLHAKNKLLFFFLMLLKKYYQLPILGTLDMSGHFHQKRNFDARKKNELHNQLLFWDIVKILQTCYFKYFENAWSCPLIMIVWPCSKLWRPKCWNHF